MSIYKINKYLYITTVWLQIQFKLLYRLDLSYVLLTMKKIKDIIKYIKKLIIFLIMKDMGKRY